MKDNQAHIFDHMP